MAVDTSYVQSSLELNPRWSAPEVIGSGHYSRAADVYSFGVVLWELLTWQVGLADMQLVLGGVGFWHQVCSVVTHTPPAIRLMHPGRWYFPTCLYNH